MDNRAQITLIGRILKDQKILTALQLDEAVSKITDGEGLPQGSFEKHLIESELVSETVLLKAYAVYFKLTFVDLKKEAIDNGVVSCIPAKFANRNILIAYKREGALLFVALRNPFDIEVQDELKLLTNSEVRIVLANEADIRKAIKLYYGVGAETVEKLVKDKTPIDTTSGFELSTPVDASFATKDSIVHFVNQLFLEAHEARATDLHLEPFEEALRIRHRIDGILITVKTPGDIKKLQAAITSRIKILANLNIAEKRRPQDGRAKIKLKGEAIDLRIATFPTLYGEGVSVRFLPTHSQFLSLDQLGMVEKEKKRFQSILARPNGIILVTGPTGCGKTTTLYAALNQRNSEDVNIVTLEDPVEYQLAGVNQIQVNPLVDLSFAGGLRSVLRQDPDIIMVGEIRDSETAHIALRAALTGHLMFSTIHTNDAVSTITRLFNIGIEPYLVASTLKAALAQRLVRKTCDACSKSYSPDNSLLEYFKLTKNDLKKASLSKGKGCSACSHTGFKGRIALFELLIVDEAMSNLIAQGAGSKDLKAQAQKSGMTSLLADGVIKALTGQTTLEEVLRVSEEE